MKTLPLKKRYNGFDYTLVHRGKRTCIYKQIVTNEIRYYEVFIIKVREERTIKFKDGERKIKAHEMWPGNEAFGKWAWTFRTLERAMFRFNELEKESD
jgi:hypothetical protein